MSRKHLLTLSSVTRDQYKSFRSQDQSNCKKMNYTDVRQKVAEFLLFLRNNFKR